MSGFGVRSELWNVAVVFICGQRHLQDLGQMQRVAICTLSDLFAAAEAIGDYEPVSRGFADGGEKFEFADRDRNLIFLGLETKRAGHPAATGGGALEVDAQAAQDGLLGSHLHDGFVMAVAVEERLTVELRQGEILRVGF
jgi:hypothetical protein